jgi:hypothetical protein
MNRIECRHQGEIDLARQKTQKALNRLPDAPSDPAAIWRCHPQSRSDAAPGNAGPGHREYCREIQEPGPRARIAERGSARSDGIRLALHAQRGAGSHHRSVRAHGSDTGVSGLEGGFDDKDGRGDPALSSAIARCPPPFIRRHSSNSPSLGCLWWVIARPEAGSVMDDGCSKPDTFVKVTGDVTLDYALDYIERKSPDWAATARSYRARLSGAAFQ